MGHSGRDTRALVLVLLQLTLHLLLGAFPWVAIALLYDANEPVLLAADVQQVGLR
jgi:hypothetical protein